MRRISLVLLLLVLDLILVTLLMRKDRNSEKGDVTFVRNVTEPPPIDTEPTKLPTLVKPLVINDEPCVMAAGVRTSEE